MGICDTPGVTLTDLQHDARPALPTIDEYLPQVLAAAGPGALRAYRSYWQRMTAAWGTLAIDTITVSDSRHCAATSPTVPEPAATAAAAATPANCSLPPPAPSTTCGVPKMLAAGSDLGLTRRVRIR